MGMPATSSCPPSRGILSYNASKIGMLQSCLSSLDSSLGTVPGLITAIDEGNCWRDFKFPDSPPIHWNAADFRAFIESPRPEGCQTPIYALEQALRGTDAWTTFLRLTRGEQGNPTGANQYTQGNRDEITVSSDQDELLVSIPLSPDVPRPRVRDYAREAPTGTSVSYLLRRLSKADPGAYERVKRGEVSAHAAAVEAGFVEHKVTVPRDDTGRAARILVRHLGHERTKALIVALSHAAGFTIETD